MPILRAGLGMLDGMMRLLPTAEVGFLGMVRNEETLEASTYAERLPDDLSGRQCYVLDPMLATGGTLAAAIRFLTDRGADHITAVCLLAAPRAARGLEQELTGLDVPVTVVVAAMDERLNEKGYIVPGPRRRRRPAVRRRGLSHAAHPPIGWFPDNLRAAVPGPCRLTCAGSTEPSRKRGSDADRNPPRVEGRRDARRGDREDGQPAPGARATTSWWSRAPAPHADQADEAFADAGVTVGSADDVWGADVVVKVNAPTAEEIGRLRAGATVISMMAPARSPELVEQLAAQGVTGLAMDAVPRISRAQSMDVLSSMANVAGYRAVVEAAHEFGRMFTGQVTAAGKMPPARVFVVGAGVAGLAAIGAASAMGAIVRAFDVRPEVAEQVESLGGAVRRGRLRERGQHRRLRQGDDRGAGGGHRRDVRRGGARRRHRHHHRPDPRPPGTEADPRGHRRRHAARAA